MIIIDRKENEDINRMVKRYKRKHRNVKIIKELRKRQHFTKPSVARRNEILNAVYRQKNYSE